MDETIKLILTWFSPFLIWWPLSGRDRLDESNLTGRPEPYLLAGALAAIPAVVLRRIDTQPIPTMSYITAHAFFQSLFTDGLAGTLLPLTALAVITNQKGRPANRRIGASQASLVMLSYVFIDGISANHSTGGYSSLSESLLRSVPKLAMAPVWGYLMGDGHDVEVRRRTMGAFAVFGVLLNGTAAFFLRLDFLGAAVVPSLISFPMALVFRCGIDPSPNPRPADRGSPISEIRGSAASPDPADASRRSSAKRIYKLMRAGRYSEARPAAEQHLTRYDDLTVYTWHALLRWLGGDRAYKLIFLRRYKALGAADRNRVKRHMEEFVDSSAPEIISWIAALERGEENQKIPEKLFSA